LPDVRTRRSPSSARIVYDGARLTPFVHQRCFIHPAREAVSLCVECRRAFCRECVVDHDGRLTCAACLAKMRAPSARGGRALERALSAAGMAVTLLLCWIVFYMAGRLLMTAEPARHGFDQTVQEPRK